MIYAVGDIHGERAKLEALLTQLPLTTDDTLVFIGDYIDRGPDSCGVIELILALKSSRPNTVFLRGNHEQMLLDARDYFRPGGRQVSQDLGLLWFTNGGDSTLASYPEQSGTWYDRIPTSHWEFIESTLMEFPATNYRFVHAGVLPTKAKWLHPEHDPRLWVREDFIASSENFGKVIVFGHTAMKEVFVMGNKIGIDTGVAYGGPLSSIAVDDELPFSAKNLNIYSVP